MKSDSEHIRGFRYKRLSERLPPPTIDAPRNSLTLPEWLWFIAIPVLTAVLWQPMSVFFPAVPWPTRLIVLFEWVLFGAGVLMLIVAAMKKGVPLVQRYFRVLLAAISASLGIALTFGGQVRLLAGEVAWIALSLMIVSVVLFRKELRRTNRREND